MKFKLFYIACLSLVLSSCGYELKNAPQSEQNSSNSNAAGNQNRSNDNLKNPNELNANNSVNSNPSADKSDDKKLVISTTSENKTILCNGREVEFTSDATANTITLKGDCKKLTVDGVSNRVTVEKVGEISVKGVSNKVTYGEGLDGKKPKITKSGTSTSVDTIKSVDEKKKSQEQ